MKVTRKEWTKAVNELLDSCEQMGLSECEIIHIDFTTFFFLSKTEHGVRWLARYKPSSKWRYKWTESALEDKSVIDAILSERDAVTYGGMYDL